jgi:ABC-type lipoprotein release transport system permease subunit
MHHFLNRQRYLLDYTVAALRRRRAKNLGLLTVYTALVFLVASVMLFSHALKREAALMLEAAPEVVVQKVTAGRHDLLPAAHVEALRGIRGVRKVEGRLWGYHFDPVVAANYTLMVPSDRKVAAGTAILGSGVAEARGAAVGDLLSLRTSNGRALPLRVVEVMPHESALVAADLLLLSERDFLAISGMPAGFYTDVALSVAHPREVRTVAEKVLARLPDSRPILREEILRTYAALFDWREGLLLVLLVTSGLAFAMLAWEKASGLSADERREIGILKAVGWDTGDVMRMKLLEGGLLSLLAFMLGFVLAYAHVFAFGAPLFASALRGWAVLYPEVRLTPAVDGLQLVGLFLLTVVPYTAATLIPVWRAAVTDPDAVMR